MADTKTPETTLSPAEALQEQALPSEKMTLAVEKKILRKLDLRVVPILWLLFLVSFIDRGNIANAKIVGMEKELHLHGNQYNNAYWVFTLGYVLFGVPANLTFQHFGPKTLSVMMFLWALTVLGQGLTHSYLGLAFCRFLEGVFEAGFVPGCATLIGSYYKRDEYLRRYVVFYSASAIAGAFNGFLASLLEKMNGVGGYSGWRWIFIIEALATIVIAVASFFLIIDFPEQTKLFSGEEKEVLLERLRNDGDFAAVDRKSEIIVCLKDWKIWAGTMVYISANAIASSVVAFQPTILKGLGYTAGAAQVHTIPVYIVAFFNEIMCCFLSELLQQRYLFAMVGVILSTIGHAIELAQPRAIGARYAGMFFVTMGYNVIMPVMVVWLAINVGRGYKRTVALGMVIAVGNAGNFIGTNVYITRESPVFHTGFSVGMAMTWVAGLFLTILYVYMSIENRTKARKRTLLPAELDPAIYESYRADAHPDFRFKL